MKRLTIIALASLALSCGKGNKSCRDNSGGFLPTFSRVFYKTKDFGGGPITIQFKGTDGGTPPGDKKLSTTVSGTVTCQNPPTGSLLVPFTVGYDYTYHAYDNSRTWDGSIPASCTTGSCEVIELK